MHNEKNSACVIPPIIRPAATTAKTGAAATIASVSKACRCASFPGLMASAAGSTSMKPPSSSQSRMRISGRVSEKPGCGAGSAAGEGA